MWLWREFLLGGKYMKTFNKVRNPIDEKGKYTNIWNKVKDIRGVSNKEKDFISNMDPESLRKVVIALAPLMIK